MNWPTEQTLRALLELPGVSGPDQREVERYLDNPRRWQSDYVSSNASDRAKFDRNLAGEMLQSLKRIVQAHSTQLVERGAL